MQTVEIMADGSEKICNFEGNSENPVDVLWNPKQVGEYFYEYLGNSSFMFWECLENAPSAMTGNITEVIFREHCQVSN